MSTRRVLERRKSVSPASFPLLLADGGRIERDRRRGERRGEESGGAAILGAAARSSPERTPRASERRKSVSPPSFPLLLADGRSIERDRRGGDRRRLGFISCLDLFEGVPYSLVEDALADCPVRRFASEKLLLEPGQANTTVFLVVEGRLRVHLDSVDSANAILIDAGGCIGEMSIIDGKPVSAFVVAEKDSRILTIDQERFWSMIVADLCVARNLLRLLTERMRRNNEEVLKGLKERLVLEHIQKELRLAHEIQEGMLRRDFDLPGLGRRVELHATVQAAHEVGGDLYDFFVMPQGGLCLVVGDVSDKGMPAALFMARAVVTVQMVARLVAAAGGAAPEPCAILSEVNRALCENNPSRMFVTMFLAILDTRTGALRYANAGHNAPYILSRDGAIGVLEGARGPALGITLAPEYASAAAQLRGGDTLFAYTDGVTEAAGPADAMFGTARLERVLRQSGARNAETLTSSVLDAVRRFAGKAVQSDDITMLAMRLPPGE